MNKAQPLDLTFTIPKFSDEEGESAISQERVSANLGHMTVVVGGNGSGKSALAAVLFRQHSEVATWIMANRSLRFEPGGSSFSISQRTQQEPNHRRHLSGAGARTANLGNTAEQLVLLDLVSQTHDARNVELNARRSDANSATLGLIPRPPLEVVNEILRIAGLSFSLSIEKGLLRCNPNDGTDSYDIAQLSDGERNAIVLSASILTANPGLVIVDEPERHMNRALSAPLLNEIALRRPDCHLVLMTHDLDFAQTLPVDTTATIVLRAVHWNGESPTSWDFDVLQSGGSVDERVRRGILGGRRRVVLCEGEETSLDVATYRLLLDDATVLPVGSASDVMKAVLGHRKLSDLNWVTAEGVIDRDHRPHDEILRLREQGIFDNGHYSIEGLLCHSSVRRAVAEHQSLSQKRAAPDMLDDVLNRLSGAFDEGAIADLAAHRAAAIVDREIKVAIPDAKAIAAAGPSLAPEIPNPYQTELSALMEIRDRRDFEALVRLVPMKVTGAPAAIAQSFGLGLGNYYRLAISLIGRNEALRTELRDLLSFETAPEV